MFRCLTVARKRLQTALLSLRRPPPAACTVVLHSAEHARHAPLCTRDRRSPSRHRQGFAPTASQFSVWAACARRSRAHCTVTRAPHWHHTHTAGAYIYICAVALPGWPLRATLLGAVEARGAVVVL
ncbi:hypothetical protein V8E53_011716 [Lactarius tabidus]